MERPLSRERTLLTWLSCAHACTDGFLDDPTDDSSRAAALAPALAVFLGMVFA